MDNPKVIVKETKKYGKALFAIEEIKIGELIAEFDGKVFEAENATDLPNNPPDYFRDHAMQIAKNKWQDSKGIAIFIAHSCKANCGVKNLTKIIAMQDIKSGEELTLDYDLSEDSDWRMKCKCGNKNCRKIIGSYNLLSKEIKEKYKKYTSYWLLKK